MNADTCEVLVGTQGEVEPCGERAHRVCSECERPVCAHYHDAHGCPMPEPLVLCPACGYPHAEPACPNPGCDANPAVSDETKALRRRAREAREAEAAELERLRQLRAQSFAPRRAPLCDVCDERPATATGMAYGLETSTCGPCRGQEDE